jgi:hypothetical protein
MSDVWRLDQRYQELRVQVVLGRIKDIELTPVPFEPAKPIEQPKNTPKKTPKKTPLI